jgi:PadR family transcriptional regulator, regulatory protein PadR
MSTAEPPPPSLPRNFLRPCVLLLLKESPAHGYDLIERLKAFGFPGSDPGGLYRMLRGLEDEGLVRSAWEPSVAGPQRRMYELTAAGGEVLHQHATALDATRLVLDAFVSRYSEYVALPSAAGPAPARR